MRTELPTKAALRELLDYDPGTGELRWLPREEVSPYEKAFNKRYAGKLAFTRVSSRGYLAGQIDYVDYVAHRIIWRWVTDEAPPCVDHINRKQTDNRWCNLRAVTTRENNLNIGVAKNNSSGITGVSWCRHTRKWAASIKVERKNIRLGRFADLVDAARARHDAEIKYNFPQIIPPNHLAF
jgi:hypothetical protein